ncbi:hypothetical protein AMS68_000954 [Peltaster fructicola]|uniref:Acylphosphatase n=1 Tax=Peltaster fructicola TaxID=286661 RepID=A0A6H0XL13_9PEZI|nr:hypothetical protein AMS68_000954 [Peltaster fructicola]
MSKRISFKVLGTVQGVNFRSWTTDKANSLNVTGFVRNADDGSVIGEAQGDGRALEKFVQHLHVGPSAAKVDKVEEHNISTKSDETSFQQR